MIRINPASIPPTPSKLGTGRIHADPVSGCASSGKAIQPVTTRDQPSQSNRSLSPRGFKFGDRPMRLRTRRAWIQTPPQ